MNYDETWEAMNNLDESFNRITALDAMLEDLQKAVDNDNKQEIIDTVNCCNAFMPVYIRQYQDSFNRAWSKTVQSIQRERNDQLDYEEIKKGLENDPYQPFHHPV